MDIANKNKLPSCWTTVNLGEIVNIKYGKGLPTKKLTERGYPVFGANGIIGFYTDYLYEEEQVLISCRGAYSGKINWSPAKCYITNNSLVLETPSEIKDIKKYLFYALQSADKSKIVTGSAQPQVTINNAIDLIIPLAPHYEQKRIVAEIEKQFSRLDEAVENLKRVKANLKRYKASVLKAAVEGKLTEEWRKKHPDVEPADKLLERILAERRNKWEEAELAKMKKAGKVPKDDKWKKKYKEPVGPGKQNVDNLPNNWVVVTLDQVSAINPRIDKKEIPEYLEVSFVPMPEVGAENGYINVKNTKPFVEVKKGFTNFLEGDVLFAKITPCMENGKMAVVPKLSNGYGFGSTEFHVIRPFYGINPYFIYYLVSNLSYRKEAAHRMIGAVGQKRVSVSFLIETVMSLPPIKEQDQIIKEVQKRISTIDGMIEISLKHVYRLRQSILKKAFSGELVPQDADNEPVKEVLNRTL
ncbi:MAG: restriction endonuclease subunit S [Desulfobacterales bacterium]|nr:restriction endonuclease subunit S [Desulfobacterales bacterium]